MLCLIPDIGCENSDRDKIAIGRKKELGGMGEELVSSSECSQIRKALFRCAKAASEIYSNRK